MDQAKFDEITEELLKEVEETSWDELLSQTGETIEGIGRMLRGKGRKKPRVWTIDELQDLREALSSSRKMVKYYIQHLREEENA